MRRKWFSSLLVVEIAVLLAVFSTLCSASGIPPGASQYRPDLTREAQYAWGINAPVAAFAGQIHQESGWRKTARSAYASGLAQFTPDTAQWISGAYPSLADNQPLNPAWALRALVTYDLHLWKRTAAAAPCDHMAFVLSAYNGGLGWVSRDQRMAETAGADPERWFGNVERYSRRSAEATRENRDYPRKILLRWQPLYASWGPGIPCRSVAA